MDLAKRDPRGSSLPQRTFRRDTTMPRQSTDQPNLEVNAPIRRPDTSDADALARILGLANEVGQNIIGDVAENRRKEDTGAAALDFGTGHKDEKRFAQSRAYRDAWQLQGAKKKAIDIGDEAAAWVTDRLNDSDHPATLDEIDHGLEGIFQKHVTDGQGNLLDFGTPEAKMVLANSLNEIRSNLLPQAQAAIKKQTDGRLLSTWAYNSVHEFYRGGAAIGDPKGRGPITPGDEPLVAPPSTRTIFSRGGTAPISPFNGFGNIKPSSGLGAPREGGSAHNGEDFPVPAGTQIVAPMQGTVVAAFSNARGGNQVRLRMADGAIVGFAHLNSIDVKQGDTISPGQQLGLSGATGHATGPHVHMTVEVGGKKVSPSAYFKTASVPSGLPGGPALVTTGNEPALITAAPDYASASLPPFDFEKAMKEVPSAINKTEAKGFLIQSLINEASTRGDVGLLKGLEDSKRADGTPSFTPDEISKIAQAREVISDRTRAEAKQKRAEMWDENHNRVIQAILNGQPPSVGWLRAQTNAGLLDPDFGYGVERQYESDARTAAAEARSEAREARAEADVSFDADVAGIVALRTAGDLGDASPEGDVALLNSGKLGTGKKALMRFNQLRAAAHAGERQNTQNPNVAIYAGQLKQNFGKAPTGLLAQSLQGGLQANITGMMGWYMAEVRKGTDPAQAYFDTVQKFAPKSKVAADERNKRIQELRAKRLMGQ